MPLDPVILMVLGGALIVVVVVYQRPKTPTTAAWRVSVGRALGASRSDGARHGARTDRNDGPGIRDAIGWLGVLVGVAAIAYGLYLQHLTS